jgi:hydroxyacylglutathione hydrolase
VAPSVTPVIFVDAGLGNSSYLLDLGDGLAVAVDPARDPAPYLAGAERAGLHLAYALETHLHADFISGSRELAARGAQVIAPAGSDLEFPHRALRDGDEVDLGGLRLRALATPGHTPEHLAYLVLDGSTPVALFSGGALLAGAVARTDLIAPDQTEALARALWRSLRGRILGLPDDLPVYPTHGAGSFCAPPSGGPPTTTIGREKEGNPLLAVPDEDAFVDRLLAGLGSFPPYFLRLRERNRRGPAVLGTPPLTTLAVEEVGRLLAGGALLVDARPVRAYATGHVPGALANPLRPQFATWLGWLVPDDRLLVFVLDPDQDRVDLVRQALNIGYERLAGELAGGMAAWQAAGLPVVRTPVVPAAAVDGPVLDVRQSSEFASGHLPQAYHVELGELPARMGEVPAGPGPLAVMCGHGERAATAVSLLESGGRRDVRLVVGGPGDRAAEVPPT